MSEEYEIIFITEEGRAIKNNKTGKIYHSEFEIIDEKNKEIDRLNNIIDGLEKYINETKLKEFEKVYGKRYSKTFTQAEVIVCNMILDKLKELKENK